MQLKKIIALISFSTLTLNVQADCSFAEIDSYCANGAEATVDWNWNGYLYEAFVRISEDIAETYYCYLPPCTADFYTDDDTAADYAGHMVCTPDGTISNHTANCQ